MKMNDTKTNRLKMARTINKLSKSIHGSGCQLRTATLAAEYSVREMQEMEISLRDVLYWRDIQFISGRESIPGRNHSDRI